MRHTGRQHRARHWPLALWVLSPVARGSARPRRAWTRQLEVGRADPAGARRYRRHLRRPRITAALRRDGQVVNHGRERGVLGGGWVRGGAARAVPGP